MFDGAAFSARYYAWGLRSALVEAQDGFSLLSRIRSRHVLAYLELAESLPIRERQEFCASLASRFYSAMLGTKLTDAEQYWVNLYLSKGYLNLGSGRNAMLSYASERERAFQELLEQKPTSRVNRRQLGTLIVRRLRDEAGELVKKPHGILEFTLCDGQWRVATLIDCGHTWGQVVSYRHSISIESESARFTVPSMSVCEWMGLASQTQWDDLYQGSEIEEVADSVSEIALWFLRHWREMLA